MIDEEKDDAQALEPEEGAGTEPVVEDADATVEAASDADAPAAAECGARIVLKRNGAETEHVFPLNPPTVIGRFDPAVGPVDVDLGPLDEGRYISRKHAKITCEDGVWKVSDLGSANGTFVLRGDFEKVEEAELTDGQEFALGNARFVFRGPGV